MKDYAVISELCNGTLVKSDGKYAVVRTVVSHVYYCYLGYKHHVLDMSYTETEIEDAVIVSDFLTYVNFLVEDELDMF